MCHRSNAVGLRNRRKEIFNDATYYMGNTAIGAQWNFASPDVVRNASVAEVAYMHRQNFEHHYNPAEIEKVVYSFRAGLQRKPEYIAMTGLPGFVRFLTFSSFAVADLYRPRDMTAALLDPAAGGLLTPSAVVAHKYCRIPITWNQRVYGKDAQGSLPGFRWL
jgi:hypothetical protein